MTYTVHLYHADVGTLAAEGHDPDAIDHPPLEAADVARLLARLPAHGYAPVAGPAGARRYARTLDGATITVLVAPTQVVLATDGGAAIVAEMLQEAAELSDGEDTVLHDPQTDTWLE